MKALTLLKTVDLSLHDMSFHVWRELKYLIHHICRLKYRLFQTAWLDWSLQRQFDIHRSVFNVTLKSQTNEFYFMNLQLPNKHVLKIWFRIWNNIFKEPRLEVILSVLWRNNLTTRRVDVRDFYSRVQAFVPC